MSQALLIAQTNNRKGKRDGDEFWARAQDCYGWYTARSQANSAELVGIGRDKMGRKASKALILSAIRQTHGLDVLAFFCHGHPWGLSLGFNTRWSNADTADLADAIAEACGGSVHIGLYACSCGRGRYRTNKDRNTDSRLVGFPGPKEGFAMHLTSELMKRGVRADVLAHLHPGHTTRNWSKVLCYPMPGPVSGVIHRERKSTKGKSGDLWPFDMLME
jgi:hypothetical protein